VKKKVMWWEWHFEPGELPSRAPKWARMVAFDGTRWFVPWPVLGVSEQEAWLSFLWGELLGIRDKRGKLYLDLDGVIELAERNQLGPRSTLSADILHRCRDRFFTELRGLGYDRDGVPCGHCGGEGCEVLCTNDGCQCETGKADFEVSA
jgi:hypothetical protein